MAYNATNNAMSHIRHHASQYQMSRNENTGQIVMIRERNTLQDFYNGFAWLGGNLIAWGAIGAAAYYFAKPYVQLLLGDNLL